MTTILAPVSGLVRPLSEAPDPVFAAEMVGSGVMILPDPEPSQTLSPAAGTLAKVHPHAVAMTMVDGLSLLVHLGIDTVKLDGEGFETLCASKEVVEPGQPLIRWSPSEVAATGLSPAVLVCVMEAPAGSIMPPTIGQHVEAGDPLFDVPAEVQPRTSRVPRS